MKRSVVLAAVLGLALVVVAVVPALVFQTSPAASAYDWVRSPPVSVSDILTGRYDEQIVVVEGQITVLEHEYAREYRDAGYDEKQTIVHDHVDFAIDDRASLKELENGKAFDQSVNPFTMPVSPDQAEYKKEHQHGRAEARGASGFVTQAREEEGNGGHQQG